MAKIKWTLENIKAGIDAFALERGRTPTAIDFDQFDRLPSARQVQRMFGGMAKLRESLGYTDLDFTKGNLRKEIASRAYVDGLSAEEKLERILVARFGEAFVHTQKRYSEGTKSRYDFFIYAKDVYFGVDIFSTSRSAYIGPNIRHKVHRYQSIKIPIFYVATGIDLSDADIDKAIKSVPNLSKYPYMKLVNEPQFVDYIMSIEPLTKPNGFVGVLEQK